MCFPVASQCFIPSHHRWFSLPTSSQRKPGCQMDRQRNREMVSTPFVCLSRRLSVCAWVCESIYECVQVWTLRPGASLAGELMKTSVLDQGQISTSVMLAVVTDSQTLRMPPSFSLQKQKVRSWFYLVSVTCLSGAPGQATCCQLLRGCRLG